MAGIRPIWFIIAAIALAWGTAAVVGAVVVISGDPGNARWFFKWVWPFYALAEVALVTVGVIGLVRNRRRRPPTSS